MGVIMKPSLKLKKYKNGYLHDGYSCSFSNPGIYITGTKNFIKFYRALD